MIRDKEIFKCTISRLDTAKKWSAKLKTDQYKLTNLKHTHTHKVKKISMSGLWNNIKIVTRVYCNHRRRRES